MGRSPHLMRGTALLGAALLAAASGGLVRADTQLGTSGHPGPHVLRDTAAAPGATCTYAGTFLDTVTVRPPRMRAVDRTAARDHQQVRWSIRVDYWDVNAFWATASTVGPWTATAWDDQAAAFIARTIAAPTGLGAKYRVVVVMQWLRDGHPDGRSAHLVDWVRRQASASTVVGPKGACPETIGP